MNDDRDALTPRQPMWRRYLRMVRPNHRADLDDELRDHLESATDRLVAQGMTREAARAEALRRFGDLARVRAEVTALDARNQARTERAASIETFLYDLRHAARGLRRSPLFTLVAAISIALGVAANTTVFSVINAILLRTVPGTHAPNLQRVYMNHHSPFEWTEIAFFRERMKSFDHLIGERYGVMSFRVSPEAEAERIRASYVTSGFFPALGVRMALGRPFDVDETQRIGLDPVTVITHALWQRRFGGDSSVIGRRVIIADRAFTIVGVAAPEFRSSVVTWAPEAFIPFAMAPVLTSQRLQDFGGSFYMTARLRDGVAAASAQRELSAVMAQLARTDSARYEGRTVRLDNTNGVNAEMRGAATAGSAFLMLMVGMVLLIACANVANLLLGRAASRRTEMGVRLAIGASRGRLLRQLLTECLLLSAIGTAVGFAAAFAVTRVLPASLPPEAGIDATYFTPDGHVFAFTAAICLLTTVLCGIAPSLRATSPNLVGMLKGAATEQARRRRRGRLVAAQTAMCVLLLAAAAYFLRGLASARGVDPGFTAQGVIDSNIDLDLLPSSIDRAQLFTSILRQASAMPGVESATLAAVVPLSGSNMETAVLEEGAGAPTRQSRRIVYFNVVGPKFFATLRTPVMRGREFLETDALKAPRVAVINESAARRLWPDQEALGKRFHWGSVDGPLLQVVGVVRDANYVMPGESPKSTVYVPLAQEPRGEMVLQLRTAADLGTTRRQIWSMLRELAPQLPPPTVQSMTDDMAITLLPVRVGATLLGTFGLIALILAGAGIYGVASYSVASRAREIGVRAALGATRGRLLGMVMYESGRRVGIGLLIGLGLTFAVGAGLSRILYGVHPFDPVVILGVIAVIALVALAGTFAPARRAAGADPAEAMRAE